MSILLLCGFIGVIHLIATLSYGVRIAGARTGKIAFCLSLFNILVLVSRTSNTLVTPALSKRVEAALQGAADSLRHDFHWLIAAASAATLIGIFLIPSFQRYVTSIVAAFDRFPSIARMAFYALSRPGWDALRGAWARPAPQNLRFFSGSQRLPWSIFGLNVAGSALLATGVLSSLYAAVYVPDLRMTTGQLSAAVNFLGTIVLFAFVDPYLSYVTDAAASEGDSGDTRLRAAVFGMAVSRLLGTCLAHLLLVPGARLIAWLAQIIPV